MTQKAVPHIIVAGGGVAALEFVLALRALAGDHFTVTIATPDPDLTLRPLQLSGVDTLTLSGLADELHVHVVRGLVESVDATRRRLRFRIGNATAYDTLVLAPGVTTIEAFDASLQLGRGTAIGQLQSLHEEIERTALSHVAFVAASSTGWLIPLYEAALLTAGLGTGAAVTLVTPERRPLERFGDEASTVIAEALRDARVTFRQGQVVTSQGGLLTLLDGGSIAADRVVAVPLLRGPRISGIPASPPFGLIPVDAFGCVSGVAGIYAIGDATDFPVKQAAVACAQADVAAAHIAASRALAEPATPFEPELRATLRDHRGEELLLNGGQGDGKFPGRHLGPFLRAHLDDPG